MISTTIQAILAAVICNSDDLSMTFRNSGALTTPKAYMTFVLVFVAFTGIIVSQPFFIEPLLIKASPAFSRVDDVSSSADFHWLIHYAILPYALSMR
jgi:hypothetical protein